MCAEHDRPPAHARATAPPARSRVSRWASIEPRSSRAKIGTLTIAIAIITEVRRWPSSAAMRDREQQARDRQQTSTTRMITVSTQPPNAPASAAEDQPDGQPDQRGDDADQQRLPGAEDHPGELVAAELVARRAGSRAAGRGSSPAADLADAGSGRAGRGAASSGAKIAMSTKTSTMHRADDRHRVAAQPAERLAPAAAGRRPPARDRDRGALGRVDLGSRSSSHPHPRVDERRTTRSTIRLTST